MLHPRYKSAEWGFIFSALHNCRAPCVFHLQALRLPPAPLRVSHVAVPRFILREVLPCPAMPCPARLCPALPCLALLCRAAPRHAMPRHATQRPKCSPDGLKSQGDVLLKPESSENEDELMEGDLVPHSNDGTPTPRSSPSRGQDSRISYGVADWVMVSFPVCCSGTVRALHRCEWPG